MKQNGFFEKTNKFLTKIIKRHRRKIQTNKIRYEKGDIIADGKFRKL